MRLKQFANLQNNEINEHVFLSVNVSRVASGISVSIILEIPKNNKVFSHAINPQRRRIAVSLLTTSGFREIAWRER